LVKIITIRNEIYRKGANPVETLVKLRGCAEFRDKEGLLSEIYASRVERRL